MQDNERVMVVPDIHQDIEFLEGIHKAITKEQFSRVIFLGDYFDAYREEMDDLGVFRSYCRLLNSLFENLGERATFLCGNHDLPYMLARNHLESRKSPYPVSLLGWAWQFSWDSAAIIREEISPAFWECLQLATGAMGHVLSHAGLHPFWVNELG